MEEEEKNECIVDENFKTWMLKQEARVWSYLTMLPSLMINVVNESSRKFWGAFLLLCKAELLMCWATLSMMIEKMFRTDFVVTCGVALLLILEETIVAFFVRFGTAFGIICLASPAAIFL